MKIVEIIATVDENGGLVLPQTLIGEMKLKAGDEVNIAYITHDSDTLENTYRCLDKGDTLSYWRQLP